MILCKKSNGIISPTWAPLGALFVAMFSYKGTDSVYTKAVFAGGFRPYFSEKKMYKFAT